MGGLVWGVGLYTAGKYVARESRFDMTREYDLWTGMLQRCYSPTELAKAPTYIDCYVSEEFLEFQKFAVWCNGQIGFGEVGFQLDKDLLMKGNKIYSPEFCVFLPQEVNKFLIGANLSRGDLPKGVSWHKATGKYQARVSKSCKSEYLGLHASPELAFQAYKVAKELYAKELAGKWRDRLDVRAYEALYKYVVQPGD